MCRSHGARTRFDAILRRAAERAGAVVEEAVSVDDLITSHGAVTGVMARSARGARAAIRGRVVIGADGLRSVIARRLGLRRSGPPRRYALTTHLAGVADVGDVGEMHIGEGYVGLGPIGGGETTIALVLPRDAMPSGHDFHRDMLPRLNRFPGLKGRFDE